MSRTSQMYRLNTPVWRVVAPLVAVICLAVLVLAACATTTQPLQRFGQRVSGQHVYDRAGILTPGEIADLEARAAGAPARRRSSSCRRATPRVTRRSKTGAT